MSLPDPDSREYRALVLSGRLAALQDVADQYGILTDRMSELDADQAVQAMIDGWRALSAFLTEAGAEVRDELTLLRSEKT
jgi:hypothetical protein